MTNYVPENMNHVRLLLGGLDDDVAVKLTPGVQLPPTVRTVADLLAQPAWPTGLRFAVKRRAPFERRASFVEVRVELPYHLEASLTPMATPTTATPRAIKTTRRKPRGSR